MCARLPVVATAVGGVPELVVEGETGHLVPPRDSNRMADALLSLARAPHRHKILGDAGYERVRTCFSIEYNVAAYDAIYARLARTHPHSAISELSPAA